MYFDFLIVGAGFYGATFARQATDAGYKCLVIDKRSHIAGNAYTRYDPETNIDIHEYGPHIFHTNDDEIWKWVNRFGEFNNYCHMPKALAGNKMYSLPFNMNTFNEIYGEWDPCEARRKLENDTIPCSNPQTVEEYALHHVGQKVYETLIKDYTEKQWQKPCSDLPASILGRLPVRWTYDNRYFNDKHQGIPVEGYTKLVANILKGIGVQLGVDYLLHKDVYSKMAKTVVFSGAIDQYYNYSEGTLEYRSLEFDTTLEVAESFSCGVSVVNFTDKIFKCTRATEHALFNPEREYNGEYGWFTYEKPIAWDETKERYYPINTPENQSIYDKYRHLSKQEPNVIFGGRLGRYRYFDMHQVIAMAMKDFDRWHSSHQQS